MSIVRKNNDRMKKERKRNTNEKERENKKGRVVIKERRKIQPVKERMRKFKREN